MKIDPNMTIKEFKEQFKPTYPNDTIVYFLRGSGVSKSIVENSVLALNPNVNREVFVVSAVYESVKVKGIATRVDVESLFSSLEALFEHLKLNCEEL